MDRYAKIQIIGNQKRKIQDVLEKAIREVCQSDFDYNITSLVTSFYDYEYTHDIITDELILIGIKIYFHDEYFNNEQAKNFLNSVLENIRDHDDIKNIVLFYNSIQFFTADHNLDQEYIRIYKEVSLIESSLREAVTLIFNVTYPEQYYKTLAKHDVNILQSSEDKDIIKKFENEFFYLSFSNYKKLTNFKNENLEEFKTSLIERLKKAVNFKEFQNQLEQPTFKLEIFEDFLLSIKYSLDPIEKVRNCIMHGRRISNTLHNDYGTAYQALTQKIGDFFQKVKPECPECEESMFIQDGQYGKFWSCSKWRDIEDSCSGSITI